jgi:transposase
MKHEDTLVVGGVDRHADSHHAAALDQRGVLLATRSFPTTRRGYRELLHWLRAFGAVDIVAVESTGSYAAALVRHLREHDVGVVEVNQPHAHSRRRRGKSDPIDAELAARLALAGKATTVPKRTDGTVESIRLLRVARERREVPHRRDGSASRSHRHRSAGAAGSALPPQDDPRQVGALPPVATLHRRARPPDSRRQVRAALNRPAHRLARCGDRRPRSTARAAG